jgi:hypothetical protein
MKTHFEVRHFTLCQGWTNAWSDIDENGEEKPSVFETYAEAESALVNFMADIQSAFEAGDISSPYAFPEFKIVEI